MRNRWAELEGLLREGVAAGVYTAAAALVGRKGELLWQGAAGRVSSDPASPPATLDTVFDLASLTKPLAAAQAVMVLVQQGKMSLDAALGEVLPAPWLPPDKHPLSIRELLAHRAGLPAWRPFYEEVLKAPAAERPTLLERLAAATPLEYPPGTGELYSDLGYMLLKAVIEGLAGEGLDAFCYRELYQPLGLETMGFNLKDHSGAGKLSFAATEAGLIAGRSTFGEVHDENAWAAGGVAGHSGLFGAGPEVFRLLQALYRAWEGEVVPPFEPGLVRLFLTPMPGGLRTPGFDTVSPEPAQSSAGRYFSPGSVGHLGFTGTSFWLDLKLGQMVVLLTNRVHFGRDNDKIRAFRPRFHEAASRALGCAG